MMVNLVGKATSSNGARPACCISLNLIRLPFMIFIIFTVIFMFFIFIEYSLSMTQ